MKSTLKKTLSVFLTLMIVLSCFVWIAPTTANALPATDSTYATGDKYGTPAWSGTGDRWFQWSTGSDYVKVYYPSHIYLDVSETLQSAGYHFDVEWHFGDNSNYRILLGAPVWGDHRAFSGMPTRYYTMTNIFSDYAVDASLPPNAPGGWYGDGTGSSTDYDLRIVGYGYSNQGSDGFTQNGARHEKYVLWRNNTNAGDPVKTSIYLKGTPSSSYKGTTTEYNTSESSIGSYGIAQSYGSNNSWPTHSSASMFNTKGSSSGYMEGEWIEMAWNVTIYDKSDLNTEIVKAGQIITAQTNYKQYVTAGNFDDLIQQNTDAQTAIVEREQTQTDIDSVKNTLYNTANALYYGASNATLLSLAAEAESYINSADYTAKYTESSRTNLENVLNGVKALSYYSSVPTYHAYSDSSAGSKAASDQSAIDSAANELQTAINTLKNSTAFYSISFNMIDGTTKKLTYAYGFTIPESSIPANTLKDADAVNHYTYSWDKEINYTVTSDASYEEVLTTEAHDWNEWYTTKYPNCTTEGAMYRTCKICNYMQEDTIPVTAHIPLEPVITNEIPASCTVNGSYLSTVYCEECANVITSETVTVTAPGHTGGEKVRENEVAPSCTVDGSYDEVIKCTVCGEEVSRKTVTVGASHINGEPVITQKPSTCLEAGFIKTTVSCTVCYEVLSESTVPVEKAEHTAGEAAKENEVKATCTTDGSYDMVTRCNVCGFIMLSEHFTTSAGDHDWGEWETVTPVSCTANGLEKRVCKIDASHTEENVLATAGHTDGENEEVERVDATCLDEGYYITAIKCTVCGTETSRTRTVLTAKGHNFGDWYVNESATCEKEGEEKRDCDGCYFFETRSIEKSEHNYESEITHPTCTENGYTTYTCSECKNTYKDNTVNNLGHTDAEAVKENEVSATCTTDGSYDMVVYCSVCGEELSSKTTTVPATDHDWGEWKVETPASCAADGIEKRVCKNDEAHFETKAITATGEHVYAAEKEKAEASCTVDGYVIMACGCGDEKTTVLPKTGHTQEAIPATDATCTETGLTSGVKCSACGDILTSQKEIPALGHDMGEYIVTLAPTCLVMGEERSDCSICDHFETKEIAKLAHTEEAVPEKVPTCTETGLTAGIKCSVCGEAIISQKTVSAKGHTLGEWTEVRVPTCSEKGLETAECSECDHTETRSIPAKDHAYNENGVCTECGTQESCLHICHKEHNIFAKIVWSIIRFICSIFGVGRNCSCGALHY